MLRTSTFLRFTTRHLLLVMLGLSMAFAIAISVLPPLMGITREAVGIALVIYLAALGLLMVVTLVWQRQRDRRSGKCLYQYSSDLPPTWIGVAFLLFVASGIFFVFACTKIMEGEKISSRLILAQGGLIAGGGFNFLLRGRSMASVQFREMGIIAPHHGFVPWLLIAVRPTRLPHVIELSLRGQRLRLEPSKTEREAIVAILAKYKPNAPLFEQE